MDRPKSNLKRFFILNAYDLSYRMWIFVYKRKSPKEWIGIISIFSAKIFDNTPNRC